MASVSLTSLHSSKFEEEPAEVQKKCKVTVNRTYVPYKIIYFCFFVGQSSVLYRSVFMKHLGMSTTQNGIIYAVDRVLGIVFPPILGAVSDKTKRPTTVIISLLMVGAFLCAGQYFVPIEKHDWKCYDGICSNVSSAHPIVCQRNEIVVKTGDKINASCKIHHQVTNHTMSTNWSCACFPFLGDIEDQYDVTFWSLLTITLLSSIPIFSGGGLIEALIFYKFAAKDRHKFGTQRMWGSLGFGLGALGLGYLKDVFSTFHLGENSAFLPYAFSPLLFWSIVGVATKISGSQQAEDCPKPKLSHLKMMASDIRMVFFLIFAIAFGYSMACGEIYLFWFAEDKFEASGAMLGLLIASTCVLDSTMCWLSGKLLRKFAAQLLMSVGLFLMGLRLLLYTTATQGWHLVVIDALLRGVSWTTTWIACCNYIAVISPPELRATTMSVTNACLWGIGYGTCGIVGGILYQKFGGENMFLISFGIVTGAAVVYVIFLIVYKRHKKRSFKKDVEVKELKSLQDENLNLASSASGFNDTIA